MGESLIVELRVADSQRSSMQRLLTEAAMFSRVCTAIFAVDADRSVPSPIATSIKPSLLHLKVPYLLFYIHPSLAQITPLGHDAAHNRCASSHLLVEATSLPLSEEELEVLRRDLLLQSPPEAAASATENLVDRWSAPASDGDNGIHSPLGASEGTVSRKRSANDNAVTSAARNTRSRGSLGEL